MGPHVSRPGHARVLSAALALWGVLGLPCNAEAAPRVAVLQDGLPGLDQAYADSLVRGLRDRGVNAAPISGPDLASPSVFSAAAFGGLILTYSPVYPAEARGNLQSFLRSGGDLVLMGGQAFATPVWQSGGVWRTRDEVVRALLAQPTGQEVLFDFDSADLSTWRRAAFDLNTPTAISPEAGAAGTAMRMELRGVTWYDVFTAELPAEFEAAPFALNAFDDYEPYALSGVRRTAPASGQTLTDMALDLAEPAEGISAIGFGFPDESTFTPLLSALDRYGRVRGWAAGLLVNYGGEYRGSNWLLFGLAPPALTDSPAFVPMLAGLLDRMAGEDLAVEAAEKNARQRRYTLPLTAPVPKDFLRLSSDGRHYVLPDGRRFFATGCDYIGSLDRKFNGGPWVRWLEEDFRKCREAGINAMRVYGGGSLYTDPDKLAALRQCAREYGVYLLLVVVDHTTLLTRQELVARARLVAEAFKDEPMVLGYDLQNEPYAHKLADIKGDDGVSLGERYPGWRQWEEFETWAGIHGPGNTFTAFPGITGPLTADEAHRRALDDTNGLFDDWIRWQVEAIREVDPHHPITVGYNSDFACLPANARLDFAAHHAYQTPDSLSAVKLNLTTFDRLRALAPDRPIFFGEFGYSNGLWIGGRHLDLHTSAVGEMMNYLYAWANGYDGCLKWALTDHPLALSLRQCSWMPREDTASHIEQGRYGMYWYDGTLEGRPKPIVWALRFLRNTIDAGLQAGTLEVEEGRSSIGARYTYRAPQALFIGDTSHETDGLEFRTAGGRPANVMLRWDDSRLMLMSTCDAEVRVRPATFVAGLGGAGTEVAGRRGDVRHEGDWLVLDALEGEVLTIDAADRRH